jgi:hypothetical protein
MYQLRVVGAVIKYYSVAEYLKIIVAETSFVFGKHYGRDSRPVCIY